LRDQGRGPAWMERWGGRVYPKFGDLWTGSGGRAQTRQAPGNQKRSRATRSQGKEGNVGGQMSKEARRDLTCRNGRSAAQLQEEKLSKIGGGARILKYGRTRRARPPAAASLVVHTRPDHPGSGHFAPPDWWTRASLRYRHSLIGASRPKWTPVQACSQVFSTPKKKTTESTRPKRTV
jgi:hypothetical protein